ncbi:MAG: hypothetical protein LBP26_00380 [Clostridiales bacterium]|jgi:hypothetical protein|nr:hypothetical protein [Clostridiales bacterium]
MEYWFKKAGYKGHPNGFDFEVAEKYGCCFWEPRDSTYRTRIYFGAKPRDLRIGDILIQEISSCRSVQESAVIGVFKCVSEFKLAEDGFGPHVGEWDKGKWKNYIDVENLTPKFGSDAKKSLEQNQQTRLYLKEEWKKLKYGKFPYVHRGWAKIEADKAKKIIEKIECIEKQLT